MGSPKAPDPYAQSAADQRAQTGAAQGSAVINNPNVYSPYGSQTYTLAGYEQVPDAQGHMINTPRYSQNIKLSPDQERLLGLQTQMQGNLGKIGVQQSAKLGKLLNTNLDTKGLPGWQTYSQGPALQKSIADAGGIRQDQAPTDRAAIEKAMMSRYNENAAKQNAAEDAQMAARGLNPGSAMYGNVADTRARALTDASNQAYLASGAESRAAQEAYNQAQAQRFGENQQQAQFYNTAQQQGWMNANQYADNMNQLRGSELQERMALRNQPLNEISALMSGSQVTVPQFQQFSRQGINAAQPGQYMGQNYANQSQAYSNMMSGIFGLGGAVAGAPWWG